MESRSTLTATLVLLCVIAAQADAQTIDLESLEATQSAAHSALARGDFATACKQYEELLGELPKHPALQRRLSQCLVGLGRFAEAENLYGTLLDEGFGALIVADPFFEKLAGRPNFAQLRVRAARQAVPIRPALIAFEIPEQRLIAEGVAFDPGTGRFFVSSTYLRKIVVRDSDGRLSDFVPSADHGLLQVLGMKVDSARSRLVVVTAADDARLIDFKPGDRGRSGVFSYDLATGRLLQATWLAEPGIHLFNDLVLNPDGVAYITDSDAGRIYRLSADGRDLAPITPRGALFYPNGIDFDPLRNVLYVAELRGIFAIDLPTGRLRQLPCANGISTVAIDGLYLRGEDLIGVQSIEGFDRVVAFRLSRNGAQIESGEPLENADPRLSMATEGVVVGDTLYFVANSHQDAVDERGGIAAPEKTTPTMIMSLALPRPEPAHQRTMWRRASNRPAD